VEVSGDSRIVENDSGFADARDALYAVEELLCLQYDMYVPPEWHAQDQPESWSFDTDEGTRVEVDFEGDVDNDWTIHIRVDGSDVLEVACEYDDTALVWDRHESFLAHPPYALSIRKNGTPVSQGVVLLPSLVRRALAEAEAAASA